MRSPARLRAGCHGLPPLTARLEPWQVALLSDAAQVDGLVEAFGSPLNLHHLEPFERNVEALLDVARSRGVEMEILFARKANKALAYVERARRIGIGVDTASETELVQSLELGIRPERLVSTAAVKSVELIRTCITASVPIVVDNPDEFIRVGAVAAELESIAPVILRLSGFGLVIGIWIPGSGSMPTRCLPWPTRSRFLLLREESGSKACTSIWMATTPRTASPASEGPFPWPTPSGHEGTPSAPSTSEVGSPSATWMTRRNGGPSGAPSTKPSWVGVQRSPMAMTGWAFSRSAEASAAN
jgi:hypothetical protein